MILRKLRNLGKYFKSAVLTILIGVQVYDNKQQSKRPGATSQHNGNNDYRSQDELYSTKAEATQRDRRLCKPPIR
jgi:uncharacterized short protein YbdD (DUF466 family)